MAYCLAKKASHIHYIPLADPQGNHYTYTYIHTKMYVQQET